MFEKVCLILSEFSYLDAKNMKLESEIINDLELNSLEIMEAVVRFEEEFQIEIPDRKISSFRTIEDIVTFLNIGQIKALKTLYLWFGGSIQWSVQTKIQSYLQKIFFKGLLKNG